MVDMIIEIVIENFALIQRACVNLQSGFTAISGETGSGKSLLLQALQLALGGRADYSMIRDGASFGLVSVTLDLSRQPAILGGLMEFGVLAEDGHLFLQRQISRDGKSVCRVNGKQVPAMVLRHIGELTVQVHSQHEHQALLAADRPMEMLDLYVGDEARRLRTLIGGQHEQLQGLRSDREELHASARERERQMDLLRYQIEEINAAELTVGELERVTGDLSRARHFAKLEEGVAALETHLLGADEDSGPMTCLHQAVRVARGLEQMDAGVVDIVGSLELALAGALDARQAIADYRAELEQNPLSLAELEDRAETIRRLLRKYGESEALVIAFADSALLELVQLENSEQTLAGMDDQIARAELCLHGLCRNLTELRTEAAPEFSGLVGEHLRQLAMVDAQFAVHLEPRVPGASGADSVSIAFSANKGAAARDLSKVASGGELARVALACQAVLGHAEGIPTQIFDEIDTGLSGRAASATGKKLRELADAGQVLAVSHLAQVVCHAQHHLRIDKSSDASMTAATVEAISGEDRVTEVARLLSGEEVGEIARRNAEAMLDVG